MPGAPRKAREAGMSEYEGLKQRLENRRKVYLAQGASDPDYGEALDAIRILEERVGELERELAEASRIAEEWWHSAGWASGHGDTLADILREMRSQHCDERSYADLAADGGLPERQELHPEIGRLRRDLAEARKDGERLDWLDSRRTDHDHSVASVWIYNHYATEDCDDNPSLRAAIDDAREPEGDGPEELDYPPTPAERLEMADRARRVK